MALLPEYGFSADQFPCLDSLYVSESNWRIDADNPTSSAYGIPQALTVDARPAGRLLHLGRGADPLGPRTTSRTPTARPCSAWEFKQANNWY